MATDNALPSLAKKSDSSYVPYRATKLWNEVIAIFRGISVGRHRRGLKSYDSCFVASEASSWLHQRLQENPNFGPQVTRSQTVQLLQKFHKARLFEDVRGFKHDKDVFTDGGRLFRFVATSPAKPLLSRTPTRTPLATRTALMNSDSALTKVTEPLMSKPPLGKGHSVSYLPTDKYVAPKTADLPRKHISVLPQRSHSCRRDQEDKPRVTQRSTQIRNRPKLTSEVRLSDEEVDEIWRNALVESIKKTLQLQRIQDVLDPESISMKQVIHNMTQVNKNGLVTNIDKKDQLPHWIISAMRCLAYWPEKVEENLPDYPGFEKDVFKVIKDYFWDLEEPLVTFQLYEIFLSAMVYADSIGKPSAPPPRSSPSQSLPSSTSVENLILNMTQQDVLGPDDILVITDPDVTVLPGATMSRRRLSRATSLPGARMETSFGVDCREPLTRIYHKASEDGGYHSNSQDGDDYDVEGLGETSKEHVRPYSICGATSSDNVFFTADDLTYSQRARSLTSVTTDTETWQHLHTKPPPYPEAPPPYTHEPPPYKPPPSYKPNFYYPPHTHGQVQPLGISRFEVEAGYSNHNSALDVSRSLPSLGPSGNSKCVAAMAESYREAIAGGGPTSTPVGRSLYGGGLMRSNSSPSVLTPLSRNRVYEVLQLCCLLLPPCNRRKLHLLLRFMNKASNNIQLSVDDSYTMKELVLKTFTRCILRGEDDIDHELLTQQIVTFMADGYTEIMKVPENLQETVNKKINEKKQAKTVDSDDSVVESDEEDEAYCMDDNDADVTMVTTVYCQQVSAADYERQKLSASQQALHTLLEDIIKDDKMKPADKKRHLHKFQKSHPDIYKSRFPTNESEAVIFPEKPRIKQPLLSKPLQKLKSLRL